MTFLKLLEAFLPAAENIAFLFVHNPSSQQKFSVIAGTVNDVLPIAAQFMTAQATVNTQAASATA